MVLRSKEMKSFILGYVSWLMYRTISVVVLAYAGIHFLF